MKIDLLIENPVEKELKPRNTYELFVKSIDPDNKERIKSIQLTEEKDVLDRVRILLFYFELWSYKERPPISNFTNIIKVLETEVYRLRLEFNVAYFWNRVVGNNTEYPIDFWIKYYDYNGNELNVSVVVNGEPRKRN